MSQLESLPRREREVFEILCRLEGATTAQVRDALDASLSDSAVRTLLTRLEGKGLARRDASGPGVLFRPTAPTGQVAEGAMKRLIDTFFSGSAASAATALLGMGQTLSPDEAEALTRLIDQARERD